MIWRFFILYIPIPSNFPLMDFPGLHKWTLSLWEMSILEWRLKGERKEKRVKMELDIR